jgi:hypothetical protein
MLRFHEASDAIASVLEAGLAQLVGDARAAVGFAALNVEGFDLLSQELIFLGPFARLQLPFLPVIITTERDFKELSEHPHRMIGFHRVDPLVALAGGSERMPKVFFRMSRCSLSRRISRWAASN